jgi:hypothetical protein
MASVVSASAPNEVPQTPGNPHRDNREQAVLPEQVWNLLALAHQQKVMQVMIQTGRILVQRETQEKPHENR